MKNRMEKKNILIRLLEFFIPFVLGVGVIYLTGVSLPENTAFKFWSLISAYFFPPLGKESVIPMGIALGIHPVMMAFSIAFVDIIVALFLVWNYELAKKIPLIGTFMEKVETIGRHSSSKYGWIKPLRFIGIILFVMVPFQGSGGLVGSILGRLIGMKPWNTFFAIAVGSVTGCLLIGYFAETLKSVFLQNFLAGVFIIILLVIIAFMVLVYRRNKKKNSH